MDQGYSQVAEFEPLPPPDLFLGVVWNDGRFEFYAPITQPRVWYAVEDVCGQFVRTSYGGCGAWADVPTPAKPVHRVVLVKSDGTSDARAHVAEEAAKLAGIAHRIGQLDRRADGSFICPHCGKPFKLASCFADHLGRIHDDAGAETIVDGWIFRERNGRSPRSVRTIAA